MILIIGSICLYLIVAIWWLVAQQSESENPNSGIEISVHLAIAIMWPIFVPFRTVIWLIKPFH